MKNAIFLFLFLRFCINMIRGITYGGMKDDFKSNTAEYN